MSSEDIEVIAEACQIIRSPERFVRAVFSGVTKGIQPLYKRIDLKPILIKSQLQLQVVTHDGRVTTTKNYSFGEFDVEELFTAGYANILVEHLDGALTLKIAKPNQIKVSRENSKKSRDLAHDRTKQRLLSGSDPLFTELGISDSQGNVKPSRMDKYKQVEEFLRILNPALSGAISAGQIPSPTPLKPLRIVDLGCGHAYLTFAAHQFLRSQGLPISVVGVDVREDSRVRNTEIAHRLEISDSISFRAEAIAETDLNSVDVAIALHACDTATDDAIAWGINSGARMLLIAPCCHHDIQKQLEQIPEPWSILTRYGVMKERLADLITDGFRAQLLRMSGYRVEVIEFVGGEHTPRNIMIRAIKTDAKVDAIEIDRYQQMKSEWQVTPFLEKLLPDNN
jgi:hypothetical protein